MCVWIWFCLLLFTLQVTKTHLQLLRHLTESPEVRLQAVSGCPLPVFRGAYPRPQFHFRYVGFVSRQLLPPWMEWMVQKQPQVYNTAVREWEIRADGHWPGWVARVPDCFWVTMSQSWTRDPSLPNRLFEDNNSHITAWGQKWVVPQGTMCGSEICCADRPRESYYLSNLFLFNVLYWIATDASYLSFVCSSNTVM